MTSRRKGGLRGKVKKKVDDSGEKNSWPKLESECRVDLERLKIERKDHIYVNWVDSRENIGLKRKLSTEDVVEPVSKKSKHAPRAVGKSVDVKTKLEPTNKKNIVGPKKGNAIGKEDQIFIDFELGKSRRISEINTLLRSSAKTKQFSSLPPK